MLERVIGNDIVRVGNLLGGRKILKQVPATELEAHDLIRRGLPGQALDFLVTRLVRIKEPGAFESAFGLSIRTYQRLRAEPARQLDSDQSSRTWQFAKILAKAIEIFGDQERAEQWLDSPAMALDRRKPIDLLSTHEGVALVETLLTRLEHGVYT